jgi:hypothetical protein
MLSFLRSMRASLIVLALLAAPAIAYADDVAEASQHFAAGNDHFQRAQRLRGDRRTHELEAALTEYFASLSRVRSRNVLYNTAIVLEQLERWDDAFNYWTEYLGVTGLSDAERADGTTHRESTRSHVAVLSIASTPSGADVWIDRRDLSSRGHTPLEIAVPAGDHHLYLTAPGHRETEATTSARTGETQSVEVTLPATPVSLQVLAPGEGTLTLDGAPIQAGASTEVQPGPHVLRLEVVGAEPVERRFEVIAGTVPMVIDLTSSLHRIVPTSVPLAVHADAEVHVIVDGAEASRGTDVVVGVAPGPHEVRLEADGRTPVTVRGTFVSESPLRLEAHMARSTDGGILAMRGVFGGAALIGMGLAIAFSVDAASQHDAYLAHPTATQADSLDAANLRSDVTWGITAALGVTALVSCFVDAGGGTSEGRFVIAPTPDGAMLAASGRFGGL